MSPFRLAALLVVVSLSLPVDSLAQTELKPRSNAAPSPSVGHAALRSTIRGHERMRARVAIGEQAPDFELDRADGSRLRLRSLRGEWVMLMFVERRESLEVIPAVARVLATVGVRTLGVVWDKAQVLARMYAGRDPGFLPLADPTGEITALYGLLGDATPATPLPGFVLIDPRGAVRLAVLGDELPQDDTARLVLYAVQGN